MRTLGILLAATHLAIRLVIRLEVHPRLAVHSRPAVLALMASPV